MSEKILEIKNLEKNYNAFSLKKINFSIKKGNITGFIGINGAGKTTTIKLLAGLLNKDGGEICFFNEVMNKKNEAKIRDRLAFLLDGEYYYPDLNLTQMKNVFKNGYSNWDENIYQYYIKRFNLNSKQKICKLSKGMKIQFSLSLALSHHAEILILDEPTSGLDPLVRHEIIEVFKELSEKGVTILFSSHITSDLEKVADEIILINGGEIIFHENTIKLESSHFVVNGSKELLNDKNKDLFIHISREKEEFEGLYKGEKEKLESALGDVNIRSANIEDIMLGYVFGRKK